MWYLIKSLTKVMVVLPLILVGSCAATTVVGGALLGSQGAGFINALVVSTVCGWAYLHWDRRREREIFKARVLAKGVTVDYSANYGDCGIAIDLKNRKVFAGYLKDGKILSFDEITGLESDVTSIVRSQQLLTGQTHVMQHDKHRITVSTKNFDCPRIDVWFGGARATCEEAFSKLRVALNIS